MLSVLFWERLSKHVFFCLNFYIAQYRHTHTHICSFLILQHEATISVHFWTKNVPSSRRSSKFPLKKSSSFQTFPQIPAQYFQGLYLIWLAHFLFHLTSKTLIPISPSEINELVYQKWDVVLPVKWYWRPETLIISVPITSGWNYANVLKIKITSGSCAICTYLCILEYVCNYRINGIHIRL